MKHMIDLPEEVLTIIIQELDLSSLNNLYNTCQWLRNIICRQGVIKQWNMSMNALSTVNTLKLNLFKDISHNLREIYMQGVPDLTKTAVIPALRKVKNLQVLDISYTNLNILDLIEIRKICPILKDITINFMFSKVAQVPNEILPQCKTLLEKFDNIHFVGSCSNLMFSKLGAYLLQNANLHHLKYTVVGNRSPAHHIDRDFSDVTQFPSFDKFSVYTMNWKYHKVSHKPVAFQIFTVFTLLDLTKYNYIIFLIDEFKPKVYASPIFQNFLKDTFDISSKYISQSRMCFFGCMAAMVWNKETNEFNDIFFNKLENHLKQYLPYQLKLQHEMHEITIPKKYDWFYTFPVASDTSKHSKDLRDKSKKRLAVPNHVLNYDYAFKEKERGELSLKFKFPTNSAVALSAECDYLTKLTYLSLVEFGRHSSDFFNILFRCCVNLETLNVHTLPVVPCASEISRSLPLTKSLKNLRLVDKRVDFKTLFLALSECPTIENIRIADETLLLNNDLADPSVLIEKCSQLYSIYLEALFSRNTKTKILNMFNTAKTAFNRHQINVLVNLFGDIMICNYDPYLKPFKLNPIRPIK